MEFFMKVVVLLAFLGNAAGSSLYVNSADYGWAVYHGFMALWMLSILHRIDDY